MIPGPDKRYNALFLRPTVGSSNAGHYDIVLVEFSKGEPTPSQSSRSATVPMTGTPSVMSSLLSLSCQSLLRWLLLYVPAFSYLSVILDWEYHAVSFIFIYIQATNDSSDQ
jgi:hypothetical protein